MERQAANIQSNVKIKIGAWDLEIVSGKIFEDFGIKNKNDRHKADEWQATEQALLIE